MPKLNPIDALLDAGATVPSSTLHTATSTIRSADMTHITTPAHNHVGADARLEASNSNIAASAQNNAGDKEQKLDDEKSKANNPKPGDTDSNNKAGPEVVKDLPISYEQQAVSRNGNSKASIATNKQAETAKAKRIESHRTVESSIEATGSQSHGNDYGTKKSLEPAKLTTRSVEATRSNQTIEAEASVRNAKGRPQRQAKQTALGKLKAKHSKTDSEDVDDMSDDSQDDGSDIFVQSQPAKKASDHGKRSKQLPTPVTNGILPKKPTETKLQGKLESVRPQQTAAIASGKNQPNKMVALGTPAPSVRVGRSSHTVTEDERTRPPTQTRLTRSPMDHRRTDTMTASRSEQQKSRDPPSQKRPGASKRPARSSSRGRRSKREDSYAFPGNTPGAKKNDRSISKALKASTTRAGPTRQRMQSESVKERLDRANAEMGLPSVSQQPSPEAAQATAPLRKPPVAKRKSDISQVPPVSLVRDTAQQRESHIVPSARSGNTANTEPHSLATRNRQAAAREKPGSSQAHAITIEQDSRSGSSSSPSPRRPADTQSKLMDLAASRRNDITRPQTPAIMRSSPPGSGRESIYTLANDKPTIIAFSRKGPRNQGFSSAKRDPGSAVSSKVFSDYRLAKTGTPGDIAKTSGLATQLFPPSSQPGREPSKQATHTMQPSNVVKGDDSIFGEFTKTGKNRALANMLQQPSEVAREPHQEDQDEGFAVIDDFEGTTLITDIEETEHSPKQPTASQMAMHPPNAVTKDRNDSKAGNAPVRPSVKTMAKPVPTKDTPRPAPIKKVIDANVFTADAQSVPAGQASMRSAKDGLRTSARIGRITNMLPTDSATESKPSKGQTAA